MHCTRPQIAKKNQDLVIRIRRSVRLHHCIVLQHKRFLHFSRFTHHPSQQATSDLQLPPPIGRLERTAGQWISSHLGGREASPIVSPQRNDEPLWQDWSDHHWRIAKPDSSCCPLATSRGQTGPASYPPGSSSATHQWNEDSSDAPQSKEAKKEP